MGEIGVQAETMHVSLAINEYCNDAQTVKATNTAMSMFLTGCETDMHIWEIWLRVNCLDLCKSSYFTYVKKH